MTYCRVNFPSATALKKAVADGEDVDCFEPGLGPDRSDFTGTVYLEGPHYPAAHTWYAKAEMVDGIITKL